MTDPLSAFQSQAQIFALAAILILTVSAPTTVAAQPGAPYAGFRDRPIKALSGAEINDLREGKGMGMALAAELNGYPGPLHVLDSADRIGLSAEQRTKTEALFAEMKATAEILGRRIIALEADLDRRFRDSTIDQSALAALTQEIGTLQGQLRAHHLGYHLRMTQLMSREQVATYNRLRGYTGPSGRDGAGHTGHGSHSGH